MKNLTLKDLEEHQEETLKSLYKQKEEAWGEANKAMDKVDTISKAIARFQTQIFIAQQFGKEERKN